MTCGILASDGYSWGARRVGAGELLAAPSGEVRQEFPEALHDLAATNRGRERSAAVLGKGNEVGAADWSHDAMWRLSAAEKRRKTGE